MKKVFQSQLGITLIELLAVLALLTIVGTVAMGGMLNSLSAYQKTAEHINLRQEANRLIETLSNLHKQKKESKIDYNAIDKTLSINGQPFTEKGYEILFSYNQSNYGSNQSLNISEENPVTIRIKLVDQSGKELEIQTTLRRLE